MAKSKYKRVVEEVVAEVTYPKRLVFSSDGSELEYVETKKVEDKTLVYYRYTKSIEKLGTLLPILDIHLKGTLSSQYCKSLK